MVNFWMFYSQSRPAQAPVLASYRKGRREMSPTVMESRRPFPPPLQLSAIGTNRAEEEVSATVESGPGQLDVTALTHGRDYYAIALADVSSNGSEKDDGENNGYAED
uniref:Uncharacterized protein n=1 Tax=Globodera rostochiensis TaxID=31243 RepID=A0A914HL94_GLORO